MINTEKYLDCHSFLPEIQLLCLCSQKSVSGEDKKAIIELTNKPIDWNLFLLLSKKHRVYPVVYKNLMEIKDVYQDEQTIKALKVLCTKNMMNSLRLMKELVKIASVFEEQGINLISFKGPVLAVYLYNNVSSRVSRDLDVLINKKDLDKAIRILTSLEYTLDVLSNVTPKQQKCITKCSHHFGFTSKDGITLELHWRFETGDDNFDFDKVWANKIDVDITGTKIHVLPPDENFLYLVFHGSKHAWKRLRWLNDIAELIKENKLNWNYIVDESKKRNYEYTLAQALVLCNALYGTPLRTDFLQQTKSLKLAVKLSKRCIPFFESTDEEEEKYGHHLFLKTKEYGLMWRHDAKKKRSYFLFHITPSTNEFTAYKIPDRFFFLYYFIRPYNLLKRALRRKTK